MSAGKKHRQARMIEALDKTLGNVTQAAELAGTTRKTHYEWMKEEAYAEAVAGAREKALDFAESKLFKLIESQNVTAIIFYLKTQGKDRGYIERIENANVGEPPFVVKTEQKGVMKVLKHVNEKHRKTGS